MNCRQAEQRIWALIDLCHDDPALLDHIEQCAKCADLYGKLKQQHSELRETYGSMKDWFQATKPRTLAAVAAAPEPERNDSRREAVFISKAFSHLATTLAKPFRSLARLSLPQQAACMTTLAIVVLALYMVLDVPDQEPNREQIAAFFDAVTHGYAEIVEEMLKGTPDLARARDEKIGDTALHRAAAKGYLDFTRILLFHGAAVDAVDREGRTPLHMAVLYGQRAIAKELLDHGADPTLVDDKGLSPLDIARQKNDKFLIEKFQNAADDSTSSSDGEQEEALKAEDPAESEATEEVDPIEEDAEPELPEGSVQDLFRSLREKDWAYTYRLIQAYPSLARATDSEGRHALHYPAGRGARGMPTSSVRWAHRLIELLLASGVDVDARDHKDRTPLHYAARGSDTEVANLLVRYGANVDAQTSTGLTALHESTLSVQVSEILIEAGADVTLADNSGITALHMAARAGYADTAELYLKSGADVNATTRTGAAPLHWAAAREGWRDYTQLIEVLLKHGGDVYARDGVGRLPLLLARDDYVVRLLGEPIGKQLTGRYYGGILPEGIGMQIYYRAGAFVRVPSRWVIAQYHGYWGE